ncbi:heterokaryon incompatibility protein-domain-containing protein [Leptodontidium sp. MPI-SDFR-AT-0119]|nr:heterokaryon incompatibility protein-domain-containing protein [Leptodontidium sp. MPI-SDFR-AT-0119]
MEILSSGTKSNRSRLFKDKEFWKITGDESYRPIICDTCGFNFPHYLEKTFHKERWLITDFPKFRVSIEEDGCRSCVWLEKAIALEIGDSVELQKDIRVWACNFGRYVLLVRFPWSPSILSFYTSPRQGQYAETKVLPWDWPLGYSISGDTSSNECFAWATAQLKSCVENHTFCKAKLGSSLPTRVLDIGTSNDDTVKLHRSDGKSEPYACLSHCWGKKSLLVTVRSNINLHLTGIPWTSLPLTYQQAITFLRQMHIQFLWIDSLCIIQDDIDDWHAEAAKMASIYENSSITLAATMSPDVVDGLFAATPPHKRESRELGKLGEGEDAPSVHVREYLRHLGDSEQQHVLGQWGINGPSPAPYMTIYTRGWCLQERLLSPRVLYFGPDELSWECNEGTACECSGITTAPVNYARFAEQMKLHLGPEVLKSYSKKDLIKAWKALVVHYSSLQLTYDRDIFPAIYGLVTHFEPLLGCRFLAGLWEDRLLQDMLWSSHGLSGPWPCRPEKWRAPTWSWASVKSSVYYHNDIVLNENSCVVLDVKCVPVEADSAGELASTLLILRGKCIETKLTYPRRQGHQPERGLGNNLCSLDMLKECGGNVHVDYDIGLPGPEFIASRETVYCLYLGEDTNHDGSWFLALRCVDQEERRFERFALVETYNLRDLNVGLISEEVLHHL